jgi:hypothetical protein
MYHFEPPARAGPVLCNVNYPRFTEAEGEFYLARYLVTAPNVMLRCCPTLAAEPQGQSAAILRTKAVPGQRVCRPGEVCRLLRISRATLLSLCVLAEHPEARAAIRSVSRLFGSLLVGRHRRITDAALVRNQ